jgi:Flp pilus assembly protein TadG
MAAEGSCLFRLASDRRGTSVFELAILLPVLFTIGLGMFEFGNLIYRYHLITVGVRDAGRYLSGIPNPAANEPAARNIATTGIPTGGGSKRVSWWNPADVTFAYTSVANDDGAGNKLYRGGPTIDMVTVSTSVAYQPLGFLGYLNLGTITLTASHEERLYGTR